MVVTLLGHFLITGRSPPLYCTLTLIAMQGHRLKAKAKQKQYSKTSNMVVIIYCFIGCKKRSLYSKWYLNGFPDGSNLGSTVSCRGEAHRHVCVFSSHLFWTLNSLDVPAGVTQEEVHRISNPPSFFGACLIFSSGKDSAFPSFVDREVEFCVLTI